MHRNFTGLILFTLFSLVSHYRLQAQVFEGREADLRMKGAEMLRLNESNGSIEYARLRDLLPLKTDEIPSFLIKAYKLDEAYSFKTIRIEKDEIGYTHIRYQMYFRNIPVLGAVIVAHMQNESLHSFNGEIYKVAEIKGSEVLTEKACLAIALDSMHAESYLWEIPEEELIIKDIKEDPSASWFPEGTMIYVPLNLDFEKADFRLTYKFNIHSYVPRAAENIYISVNGEGLIARENQLHTTDVPGKAHTKYSGVQNIITDSTAPYNYRLRENTRGNGVYTFNMKKGTSYGAATDFLDSNNVWNNVNINKDEIATDAHWGAETTFDYFKNKFNRNSYNNNNARINSYVHYANNYDNAFWDGLRMTYGDGNAFKPLTSLDVCGHEIAHAVTSSSANLIYSYESGQLNESFSDIFGNSVERFGKPASYSWIIGEEITYNGSGLRNMSDPRIKGHPRCYKGTYWYYGTGDNGGVHLNSGVQNWWYYLITEGGSGTNDFSNAYKVDSLGILTAEKIAYRNLTVYLTPSSNYSDARFYSIQSAKDLYGACSKEVIAVTNAWYACAVGPKYDSGYVKADFSADTVVCSSAKTVNFKNLSSNALSSLWYFGDGNSSIQTNPSHTYGGYANYTIKLVVTSCFKNIKDSLTKTAYVKIDSTFDICNAVLMPLSGTDSTHKCESFVYDDGGEDIYTQQRKTNLRISVPGADSIRIRFLDLDYELNYDSLYIYSGKFPGGVKIAGYTGSVVPNGGNYIAIAGNMVTLRHISDPYVVGRGFKLFYKAVRKPLKVTAYSDTSICNGTSVWLRAKGSGGYAADYRFKWDNLSTNDSLQVNPVTNTAYKVRLTDICTRSTDSASITVSVKQPLQVNPGRDTLICAGNSINLQASGSGGDSLNYTFSWDNGLGNGAAKNFTPSATATYRVILSDACTPLSDTAFVRVRVKDALKVEISSNDTLICYNKISNIYAEGSGGDSMNHFYMWSNGLGIGKNISPFMVSSQWAKVTLTDMCSAKPALDSVYIVVRPQLKVDLNNDTTICRGSEGKLIAIASGGDPDAWQFNWNPAMQDTSELTVKPGSATKYIVTLQDQCSNEAKDSMVISLMAPIVVTGLKDTTICNGMQVPLQPMVSGGRSTSYSYTWNNGLPSDPTQLVAPTGNSNYRVIVNDGCTVLGDTAFANINVKGQLNVNIISNDTVICFGKTSQLNVNGNGGDPNAYDFDWSHGLGKGTAKSITLNQSEWIKVTLSDGCTVKPDTDSIYILVRPEMTVSLPADTLICKGSDINLDAIANGGDNTAYSYKWNQSLASVNSHVLKPVIKTLYTVELRDNCSDSATDSVWVDVLPGIKISGLRDTLICYGAGVNFNPIINGGIPAQYVFTWDNGLGSNKTQSVNPLTTTSYKLKAEDNCTRPGDSVIVTVSVRPALLLDASLDKQGICSGDSATLNLNFSGGIVSQYQWSVNGQNTGLQNMKVSPLVSTPYTINLTDFCSDPVSKVLNLTVNPKPILDFNADETIICQNSIISFNNLSSGAEKYIWFFSTNDSQEIFEPMYQYKNPGVFDVVLKAVSDSGCTAELSRNAYMDVRELPVSRFTYLPNIPDYLNREVGFSNLSLNQVSFEWDFGDSYKESTVSNPMHTYPDTGHYPVRLIVRNSIGCADTATEMLRVKDVFRVYIPDAISMNGDHVNDSFIVLGRGILTYNLKIYNRWGEMVYKGDMGSKPFDGRDASGMPLMKGTYVVNLTVRDFEGFMHYIRQVLEIL